MALTFPGPFPEPYTIPVLSAETEARVELKEALAAMRWLGHGGRYVDKIAINVVVVRYLNAVCSAFAAAACAAVGDRALRAALLDSVVEAFIEHAQRHLHGLGHEKIAANSDWQYLSRFIASTRDPVLRADWHTEYLQRVPKLFAELSAGNSGKLTEDDDPAIAARAESRRGTVNPRLSARGINVRRWAELAGVDRSVAYDYLKGESMPRQSTRQALAEALDLRPDELPE